MYGLWKRDHSSNQLRVSHTDHMNRTDESNHCKIYIRLKIKIDWNARKALLFIFEQFYPNIYI